ncbi:hypothetical protein L218DRAFT_958386 [Marasmius fiardii PR-910]|nr:hypothetical protein L218DRAFT_958386 [Marasmius fiardii PR-910]
MLVLSHKRGIDLHSVPPKPTQEVCFPPSHTTRGKKTAGGGNGEREGDKWLGTEHYSNALMQSTIAELHQFSMVDAASQKHPLGSCAISQRGAREGVVNPDLKGVTIGLRLLTRLALPLGLFCRFS